MKILVTGSEGFVGKYVVRKLLDEGHEVVGVDCFIQNAHESRKTPKDYEFIENWIGSVCLNECYDCVIHLAAAVGVGQSMYSPGYYVNCNSQETARLLKEFIEHTPKRVVVASSMSIYGEGAYGFGGSPVENVRRKPKDLENKQWEPTVIGPSIPTPETKPPDLTSIYALTKYDQEQMCLIWGSAYHIPTVALRFFNIYGPGQALQNPYTGALAIFGTRLLNGKAPVIYEDGQQTRDFINVYDVAEAVIHAATNNAMRGVYNVGTGIPRTIESIARVMSEEIGANIPPEITSQYRAGDIRHCHANIDKIRATGWSPQIKFEDGITHYCEWLRLRDETPEDRFDEATKELQNAGLLK